MPDAKSLADLLRIRNENRQYLDSIIGNLGSTLGFKKRTGYAVSDEPAVLMFVRRKIDSKWLPKDQVIKPALKGPDNLTCPLDVIEGNRQETLVKVVDEVTKEEFPLPWSALQGPAPLTAEQLRLREKLQVPGWSKKYHTRRTDWRKGFEQYRIYRSSWIFRQTRSETWLRHQSACSRSHR